MKGRGVLVMGMGIWNSRGIIRVIGHICRIGQFISFTIKTKALELSHSLNHAPPLEPPPPPLLPPPPPLPPPTLKQPTGIPALWAPSPKPSTASAPHISSIAFSGKLQRKTPGSSLPTQVSAYILGLRNLGSSSTVAFCTGQGSVLRG